MMLTDVGLTTMSQTTGFTFMLWYYVSITKVFDMQFGIFFLNSTALSLGTIVIPIKSDSWTHFCMSNIGAAWGVYDNGTLIGEPSYTLTNHSNFQPTITNFKGFGASIRLYNTKLAASDIYDQYLNRGSVAAYDFSSNQQNILGDVSGWFGAMSVASHAFYNSVDFLCQYFPKMTYFLTIYTTTPAYLNLPVLYLRSVYGFTVCMWVQICVFG